MGILITETDFIYHILNSVYDFLMFVRIVMEDVLYSDYLFHLCVDRPYTVDAPSGLRFEAFFQTF
jgi:hypothetical protein